MKDFNINHFTKNILLTLFVISCIAIHRSEAQRFKGSAVFGLNLAQIDGDTLAGFSKLGLTGGLKLAYPLKENVDINFEMLYSQSGSSANFGFGGDSTAHVDLKYIELPLSVNIKDWYIEDGDYHKVMAHAGLSYGYLFSVDAFRVFTSDIDQYSRHSINYVIGVDYFFTSRLGLTLRYNRSFNSLLTERTKSYFVTVRTEYVF